MILNYFQVGLNVSKIEFYDYVGRKVGVFEDSFERIDVANLSTGQYFAKIYSDEGVGFKKFLKD